METLKISDKEIHSLEELRQNFDLRQVVTAFLDCTLERWLADCFYEKHSEQVRKLDHAIGSDIERELCRILGVDYVASGYLSEEQRIVYERKCLIIQQHSDDPKLLEHALDTATNQAELAEFLHSDRHRIYLCGSSFNVPIRISGVHYIGMLPTAIVWEDGVRYEVDRVIDIRPGYSSKAGGQGDRYVLQVNGHQTCLYFERSTKITGNVFGRWFAVRKVPKLPESDEFTEIP